MKTPATLLTIAAFGFSATDLTGEARRSESYTLLVEEIGGGGHVISSPSYTALSSFDTSFGDARYETEGLVFATGFTSQLYDVTAFTLTLPSSEIDEEAQMPLSADALLDDGSILGVSPADVNWIVEYGPLYIDGDVLGAEAVYQDTPALLSGRYWGFPDEAPLLVRLVDPDNFGIYAGDGIPDSWQVEHFGEDNPDGMGGADPHGTGHTNYFRYIAGLNPLDPNDVFRVEILKESNDPGEVSLVFSPLRDNRTYAVKAAGNLSAEDWRTVDEGTVSDEGDTRTVSGIQPTFGAEFYRVRISLDQD